ncbi:hypothetical protein [Zunongwangia profunda]|uniref:hypothetical protein n=1 Tax=Zunongwangia profunda TaxID=398743 RepID=UPI00248F25B6|nr:hypothetical protein [Zunongwangia profunda]|tara:strand:+ start:97 stop:549 length:453 start_codon:yes stop_codon:yes gene_type:complete
MKNIINQIFNRKVFRQIGDAVIFIDLLFASFLLAIAIAGIGLFNAVNYGFQYSFFEFLFFIPFIVLVALFISKWHTPKSNWEDLDRWSKLNYLKGLKSINDTQLRIMEELSEEFIFEYGLSIEQVKMKWYNRFQPFVLLIGVLILYFIFT